MSDGDWTVVKDLLELAANFPGNGEDSQKRILRRAATVIARLLDEKEWPRV